MIDGFRVVFTGLNEVEVQPVEFRSPGRGEALIKTEKTLISTGTELAWLTGIRWEKPGEEHFPAGAGYSNVGRVLEVGEGVDHLQPGDRVLNSGAHATHALQPQKQIWPIPDDVDSEVASLGVLAEIAMGGLRRGRLAFGETVVVVGAGLVGQLAAHFCRCAGAWPVIMVDPSAVRLPTARRMGATHTLDCAAGDAVDAVTEWTRGRKADVVLEVTGNPQAMIGALKLARPLGRVVLLGSPRGSAVMNLYDEVHLLSLELIGAHNMGHPPVAVPQAPWTVGRHVELFFDWQAAGICDVRPLISHRFPGMEAPAAYRMLIEDRSQALGVVFDWGQS